MDAGLSQLLGTIVGGLIVLAGTYVTSRIQLRAAAQEAEHRQADARRERLLAAITEFFSAARSIETVAAELERTKIVHPPNPVIWERFFNAHVILDLLVEQSSRKPLEDFVAALLEAERGDLSEENVAKHLKISRRVAREHLRREIGNESGPLSIGPGPL